MYDKGPFYNRKNMLSSFIPGTEFTINGIFSFEQRQSCGSWPVGGLYSNADWTVVRAGVTCAQN
jgi:hypothetical protein